MINGITIAYQSHKGSIINFDRGVNVIIGSSDQGKTAIIRAIRWVVDNRPSGSGFIPHGDTNALVLVKTEDGYVTRIKGDAGNHYKIDNGDKFEGFGLTVPNPIKNLLNISDINFQNQMDAPFLLSSSSGEVSRYLNNIVNLEKIDTSIANITRKLKDENKELKVEKASKEMMEAEVEELSWIPDAEDDLRKLVNIQRIAHDARQRAREIKWNLANIKGLENKLEEVRQLTSAKDEVERLQLLLEEVNEIKNKRRELSSLIIDIKTNESNLRATRIRRKKLEEELEEMTPSVCPLCGRSDD